MNLIKIYIIFITILLYSSCNHSNDINFATRPINKKANYYVNLQNELSLLNSEVKELKLLNEKFEKKFKKIPASDAHQLNEINALKKKQLKKLLGQENYKKKKIFDKSLRK